MRERARERRAANDGDGALLVAKKGRRVTKEEERNAKWKHCLVPNCTLMISRAVTLL